MLFWLGFPVEFFCTKIMRKLRKDLLRFQFFSYAWALYNYMQKLPVFMRNIINKSDFNFVFSCKKIYIFQMNAQFRAKLVSYWYENYAEFRHILPRLYTVYISRLYTVYISRLYTVYISRLYTIYISII